MTVLNPNEVKRRREATPPQENIEAPLVLENYAGCVKIDYETMGRFDTPSSLYFKDFTNKHVNDITLTNPENLLEVITSILQETKQNEPDFKIENMTGEELLETLIAIKIQFEGAHHEHRWLCDCQGDKEDTERIINDVVINLLDLNYISIDQVDEKMRTEFKDIIMAMTDEEFKTYVITKYKNDPIEDLENYSREEEIEKVKVKEPISIIHGGTIYSFNFPRIKDIIKAKKYADKIFIPKIKAVQNRKSHGVSLGELKLLKEKEIEKLREDQGRLIFLYAKAMMLQSIDGENLSDAKKLELYTDSIPRQVTTEAEKIFGKLQFGLNHEIELTCPVCGTTSKRLLQRSFNPRELLPNGSGTESTNIYSAGESKEHSGLSVYFGI